VKELKMNPNLNPMRFVSNLDLEGMMLTVRPEFWLETIEKCYDQLTDKRLCRCDRHLNHDDETHSTAVRRACDGDLQTACASDKFECLAENELFTIIFYNELHSLASEI
jgi:hypothetical protein